MYLRCGLHQSSMRLLRYWWRQHRLPDAAITRVWVRILQRDIHSESVQSHLESISAQGNDSLSASIPKANIVNLWNEKSIKELLSRIKMNHAEEQILVMHCNELRELMRYDGNKRLVEKLGAFETILHAMSAFPQNTEIQSFCLLSLLKYFDVVDHTKFYKWGKLFSRVVETFLQHPENRQISKLTMVIIHLIPFQRMSASKNSQLLADIDGLLARLPNVIESTQLFHIVSILTDLCKKNNALRLHILKSNGISKFFDILTIHSSDPKLLKSTLFTLELLLCTPKYRSEFEQMGGVKQIINIMSTFSEHRTVQERTIMLLKLLAEDPILACIIADSPAVGLILGFMNRHLRNDALFRSAAFLLRTLSIPDDSTSKSNHPSLLQPKNSNKSALRLNISKYFSDGHNSVNPVKLITKLTDTCVQHPENANLSKLALDIIRFLPPPLDATSKDSEFLASIVGLLAYLPNGVASPQLTHIVSILKHFCRSNFLKLHMAKSNGVSKLFGILNIHSKDPSLLSSTLFTLVFFLSLSEYRSMFEQMGGIKQVIAIMEAFPSNKFVQEASISVLWKMSLTPENLYQIASAGGRGMGMPILHSEDEAIDTTIVEIGVLEFILKTMQKFSGSNQLQHAACGLLWNLSKNSKICIDLFNLGCLPCVIACMKGHSHDAELHAAACGILWNLCVFADVSQIIKADIITTLISSMLNHSTESVHIQACGALWCISQYPKSRSAIISANGIKMILVSLSNFHRNKTIPCYSWATLSNLLIHCADSKDTVIIDNLPAVLRPMPFHLTSVEIQLAGCSFINNITTYFARDLSDDAIGLCISRTMAAHRLFPENLDLMKVSLEILSHLAYRSDIIEQIVKLEGIELTMKTMKSSKSIPIFTSACSLFKLLINTPKHRNRAVEVGGLQVLNTIVNPMFGEEPDLEITSQCLPLIKELSQPPSVQFIRRRVAEI